jgi:hypothetical protein
MYEDVWRRVDCDNFRPILFFVVSCSAIIDEVQDAGCQMILTRDGLFRSNDFAAVETNSGSAMQFADKRAAPRRFTRRDTVAIGVAALGSILAPAGKAAESLERHGISAFGDLKYQAGFRHFDYVNPNAPKGGVFSQVAPTRILQPGPADLQLAQQLHSQGRCRPGHRAHLCKLDDARL